MKSLFRSLVVLLVVLFSFVGAAEAGGGGGTQPLCATGMPGCVSTNWGVIEPDSADAAANAMTRSAAASTRPGPISVALHPAATGEPTVKTTVSPSNLFTAETQKLVAALQRARFNRDGSIAKGEAEIAAAAADLVQKAAGKYMLTIYLKVPPHIAADERSSLGRKVQAVNAILASPAGTTKPQT